MTSPEPVWGLVLAAGGGVRLGQPKQYLPLGSGRLVDHAVATVAAACDATVVVVPPGDGWTGAPVAAAVAGGVTRAASVRAGLSCVPEDAEVIVIHDAAHPLAAGALVTAVVAAVRAGADGACPVLPLTEAVKVTAADRVVGDLRRQGHVMIQTPQAFRAGPLRAAHEGAPDGVEDVELVLAVGGQVVTVPGDPLNLHVTTGRELAMARLLLPMATPPRH